MSIITLSIFLVFYKNFKVSKILYIFLIITIIVFSVKINPATKERFDDFRVYTENENSLFKSFLKTDWGKHYKVSVMMINENKLFGTGIRSFRYECKKFLPSGCSTHPHHYVLEILVETGSIFLIFFLILNLNIIKMYFRDNIGHQVTSLGFLSIFLSFLFPVRPTGSIFSSWHGSFMWILLAFLLFSYKYKLKNNEK